MGHCVLAIFVWFSPWRSLGGLRLPRPPQLGPKLQKRSKNLQALPTTSKDDTSAALNVESCTCDAPRRFIQSLLLLAKISKDDVSSPRPTTTIVDRIVDHTTKGLANYEGAAVDRRLASSIIRRPLLARVAWRVEFRP